MRPRRVPRNHVERKSLDKGRFRGFNEAEARASESLKADLTIRIQNDPASMRPRRVPRNHAASPGRTAGSQDLASMRPRRVPRNHAIR